MSIVSLSNNDFALRGDNLYITNNETRSTPGMLLIWADWCPHCHDFLPKYKQMCKQLGDEFKCASIEHKEFAKSNQLSSALDFKYFPTIKFFDQHGKIVGTYEGNRQASDILSHVCKVYHHCIMYH